MRDSRIYKTDLEYALSRRGKPETYAEYDAEKARLEGELKGVVVSNDVAVESVSPMPEVEPEKWICEICGWSIKSSCKGLIAAHISKELKTGRRESPEKGK